MMSPYPTCWGRPGLDWSWGYASYLAGEAFLPSFHGGGSARGNLAAACSWPWPGGERLVEDQAKAKAFWRRECRPTRREAVTSTRFETNPRHGAHPAAAGSR